VDDLGLCLGISIAKRNEQAGEKCCTNEQTNKEGVGEVITDAALPTE
jgi:hypothetical protein